MSQPVATVAVCDARAPEASAELVAPAGSANPVAAADPEADFAASAAVADEAAVTADAQLAATAPVADAGAAPEITLSSADVPLCVGRAILPASDDVVAGVASVEGTFVTETTGEPAAGDAPSAPTCDQLDDAAAGDVASDAAIGAPEADRNSGVCEAATPSGSQLPGEAVVSADAGSPARKKLRSEPPLAGDAPPAVETPVLASAE